MQADDLVEALEPLARTTPGSTVSHHPYARNARIIGRDFVKSFFIAKDLCEYTMNYLRQE
jgi:hypothetical protein